MSEEQRRRAPVALGSFQNPLTPASRHECPLLLRIQPIDQPLSSPRLNHAGPLYEIRRSEGERCRDSLPTREPAQTTPARPLDPQTPGEHREDRDTRCPQFGRSPQSGLRARKRKRLPQTDALTTAANREPLAPTQTLGQGSDHEWLFHGRSVQTGPQPPKITRLVLAYDAYLFDAERPYMDSPVLQGRFCVLETRIRLLAYMRPVGELECAGPDDIRAQAPH